MIRAFPSTWSITSPAWGSGLQEHPYFETWIVRAEVVHDHVRNTPGDLGFAVIHIFRFENSRIVELWDLGQPLPEETPNQYGMF